MLFLFIKTSIRMTKIQTLLITIFGEDKETGTLEDTLVVSFKAKQSPVISLWSIYFTGLTTYASEFFSRFIHNCQKQKQPRCPSAGDCISKLWYLHMTQNYSEKKRMSSHATQRHLLTLNEHCYAKEATVKMLCTGWFHLYHILETEKL